jgi:membrane-bound metal-dependent hydrolase YbcI (DUF457 family)
LPLTPFHYPIAYFLYKLDKRLSLPALIVGCIFPDLEIPIIILLFGTRIPNHLVLHSLLGSATIGTLLAIIITIQVYPSLVSYLFGVEKKKVKQKCKLSFPLFISILVGGISHVLLDVTNHRYNPVFWPFLTANGTPGPFFFALGEPFGYLWMQVIMGVILMMVVIIERKNLFEALLVG